MTTTDVWRNYSAGLLRYFRSKTNDAALAEDLRQEVFYRVHKNLNTVKDNERVQHWLNAIAHNVLADHWKSLKKTAWEEPIQQEKDSHSELAETCVRSMISTLPESYAVPLRMSDLEGIKQDKIAKTLGLNLSATKSRIQRGREKLRAALITCCHVELNQRGEIVDSQCSSGHCTQCTATAI